MVASFLERHRLSGMQFQELWHKGLVAVWHVESSRARDLTCVPYIGRWVLNHWTTRDVHTL